MWRPRTLLLLGLGTLWVLALVGSFGTASAASTASSPPPSCQVHYHPLAGCSVPSGGTLDPCSILTAGATHCSFGLPDFNPADWAGWLGCQFVAQVSSFGQAIWNAIQSYVGNFLVWVVQSVLNVLIAPIVALENALSGAIVSAIQWFGSVVAGAFQGLNTAAAPLGPFAPIVVVGATLLIFILAGLALYIVVILLFAFGKTAFNLL